MTADPLQALEDAIAEAKAARRARQTARRDAASRMEAEPLPAGGHTPQHITPNPQAVMSLPAPMKGNPDDLLRVQLP